MRFPSVRLMQLALIVILSPFAATASDGPDSIEIPADARILITDGRGVIVGAGETSGGETFRLALVEGFSGAGTLIFMLDDGSFQEIEVVIGAGGVSIGDRRLRDLVASSFAHVAIGREIPGSGPPSEALGPDEDVDRGPLSVPPAASPPAVGPADGVAPDGDAPADAPADGPVDAPGDGAAPTPPVGASPPDAEDEGEPTETEPTATEPPADAPSPDLPSTDEGPSEAPDDAPDRGRP